MVRPIISRRIAIIQEEVSPQPFNGPRTHPGVIAVVGKMDPNSPPKILYTADTRRRDLDLCIDQALASGANAVCSNFLNVRLVDHDGTCLNFPIEPNFDRENLKNRIKAAPKVSTIR